MEKINIIIESWKLAKPNDCEQYKCPRCENTSSFHSLFVKHNSVGCWVCDEFETIVKRMLEQRGIR